MAGSNGRTTQRMGTELSDRSLLAQARPRGRAYIFLRRWGANGNGHAGWGYKVDDSNYDCGSIENNSGHPTRNKDETNDAWFELGVSQERMHGLMKGGVGPVDNAVEHYNGDEFLAAGDYLVRPAPYQTDPLRVTGRVTVERNILNPFDQGRRTVHTDNVEFRRYTEYAWIDVENFDIEAPRRIAQGTPNIGYGVFGNNCANVAYDIVHAYGVPGDHLGWLQTNPQPSQWFDDCLGKGWTRVAWPDLAR